MRDISMLWLDEFDFSIELVFVIVKFWGIILALDEIFIFRFFNFWTKLLLNW